MKVSSSVAPVQRDRANDGVGVALFSVKWPSLCSALLVLWMMWLALKHEKERVEHRHCWPGFAISPRLNKYSYMGWTRYTLLTKAVTLSPLGQVLTRSRNEEDLKALVC